MLKIILKPILALLLVCILIYITLCLTEATTLPSGTKINCVNCGGMTAEKAAKIIADKYKFHKLTVMKDDEYLGEIKAKYNIDKAILEKELDDLIGKYRINPVLWYKLTHNYKMKLPACDDKCRQKMKQRIKKLDGNKYTTKTKDAFIDYNRLKIIKEVKGDDLNFDKLERDFSKEALRNENVFMYEKKNYIKKPVVTSKDKQLKLELKFCKQYIKGGLDIDSNSKTIHISNKTLRKIIMPSTENKAIIDNNEIKKLINRISKKYDLNKKVIVTLHHKKTTLKDYGNVNSVDEERTAESINKACQDKINKKNTKGKIFFTYNKFDYTRNYIEVSISKQKLYYYKNGQRKMTCNVVTGKPQHPTPKGAFSIMWKERNTVLRGFEDNGTKYASPVSYWMPLTDMGVGLHDANWRGEFGGDIYKYNGSHGCVNMPPDRAAWLYDHVSENYPVFIH